MIPASNPQTPGTGGVSRRLVSAVATLVLSYTTGTPLRSVGHLLPHPGDQAGPYLGV